MKNKKINFRLIYSEQYESDILAIDWNQTCNIVLVAYRKEEFLTLELKSTSDWSTLSKGRISNGEKLINVVLQDNSEFALLLFEKQAILINLSDYSFYKSIERQEGFLTGSFGEEDIIHFSIPASSGSVDWAIWNYQTGNFQEYELERYDHYGRGAILHPSKKLIGACWNAYESGFLIHLAHPENKRLKYFDFSDNQCNRPEYEAFAPSFNYEGDKIAFVVNPYLGGRKNIEKLCCYNISEQVNSLLEVELTDSKKETVRETHFLGDSQYILLNKSRAIDIIDFETGRKSRLVNHKIDNLSVNCINSKLIFSVKRNLKVLEIIGQRKAEPTRESRMGFTNAFISRFYNNLKIVGDEE